MSKYRTGRRSPGPGQMTLDFDQEMADLLPTLINFLRGEPDFTEVAQELTMDFLRDFQARWIHFAVLHDDAALRVLGAFGLPLDASPVWDPISLWSPLPMAEAVRSKESSVLLGESQEAKELPSGFWVQGAPPSVVAVPLTTSTKTVGVMTIGFDHSAATGNQLLRHLEAIADVVVLYVASWVSNRDSDRQAPAHAPGAPESGARRRISEHKPHPTTVELTRRQKAILAHLADGLTYDQIGSRIGFSNSTVRMELMQIYRLFGVSSRDAAVAVCLDNGLLDHRSVDEDIQARLGASSGLSAPSSERAS